MDETTKVLIATISGFLIAFLAEPFKIYFQNKARLRNLQIALQKELISNYLILLHYDLEPSHSDEFTDFNFIGNSFRTECYKHSIQTELILFYQLAEANMINEFYSDLSWIVRIPSSEILGRGELLEFTEKIDLYESSIKTSLKEVAEAFHRGILDIGLAKRIMSSKDYQEMLRRGKEASRN